MSVTTPESSSENWWYYGAPGDAEKCLCGITNCDGHEVVDGCAIFYDHPDAPTRVARVRLWLPDDDTIT